MKVIDNISKKFHLSESGQGVLEMKFALFDRVKKEVITPFCKCKDYFNDAFWTFATGKKTVNQYGFSFSKENGDGVLDKERLSVAIRFNDRGKENEFLDVDREKLRNMLSLLHRFEQPNNFSKSRGILSEDNKFFIINFDRKWTDIPYLASGFFLLLRMGYHYDRKTPLKEFYANHPENFISPGDAMYYKNVSDVFDDLESGYIDQSQSYSDFNNHGNVHSFSGIQGYKTTGTCYGKDSKKYTPKLKS
jgi:hypothetical protein